MERDIFTFKFLVLLLWLACGKLLTVALFTVVTNSHSNLKLRVYNVAINRQQTIRELKSSWLVLTDPIVLALLAWFGLIKFAPESPTNILLTVGVFFIWAEVWFYWTHRLMHSHWLWKIHQHHHLSEITQPLSAASFSFVEKFVFYTCGWLFFLAFLSWYLPISLYGIVAFYTYYFITSPIAHSNTELTPHWIHELPFGIGKFLGTATGHALHHDQYGVNYGFITSVLDRVFGTYRDKEEQSKPEMFPVTQPGDLV